ncbi:MAG: hypothetical protein K9M02_03640 [Thiohalocapsa sp.]|nr:hypothetical protein [Thiohalocapsa sp.]
MPELPDVEVYKRRLDAHALGQEVARVEVPEPAILRDSSPQALGRRLHEQRLQATRRHGKFLFLRTAGGDWLVMHFGMSGRLEITDCSQPVPKYTDLQLVLGNGCCIDYVAPRKLGFVAVSDDPRRVIEDRQLGPDALGLDADALAEMARGRRGGVKCWLMDQQTIAGIGNVYSDEILLRAGIHPKTAVADLDDARLKQLFDALSQVLRLAIDAGADPTAMPRSFLLPEREQGRPCPRCGGDIKAIKVCGRTAYYCPTCQR